MTETKDKKDKKEEKDKDKTSAQIIADGQKATEKTDGDSDTNFEDDGGSDVSGLGNGPLSLEDIYTKLFPLDGKIDDNNRYLDLKAADINSVQLLEPTLGVTEFVVKPKDRLIVNDIPERMAFRFPLCAINEHMIEPQYVYEFCLDYTSFIPSLTIEFVDFNNQMLSTNSVKDGSIIKVYVGGSGDEMYYKPIRQDFIITNIQKMKSGRQNQGEFMTYRLNGKLNVPMGNRKESWSNNAVTSMQEMFNLAVYTGLGFSTNFTYSLVDEMKWENTLGTTYFEFMQWIADHACYSPNTFFTAFVDQYYVLNFVECHCLLSHGGTKNDTPAMIYSNFQQDEEPSIPSDKKDDGKITETTQQIDVDTNKYEELKNPEQQISYYFLSNYHMYKGWSNYIESWNEISDGYSSMDEGYKKHATYADYNSSGLGTNCEFNIFPIDNLPRDPETQEILSLPEEVTQDSYIPLNLMQTNNEEYKNDKLTGVDKMSEVESYDHFGQVDTTNMHKLFFFAECQNTYQMRCMKKCGLRVTLQNYNPSIIKFSRVWVDIYDMNSNSSENIKPDSQKSDITVDYSNWDTNLMTRVKKAHDDNIIYYADEGLAPLQNKDMSVRRNNENYPMGNYNRSLSGWYVVTEMKICFDSYDDNMKHMLTLNRIEHKPLFKSEYKTAQQAVEKYKEENKMDYLFQITDDFSYNTGGGGGGGDTNGTTDGSVDAGTPVDIKDKYVLIVGDSITDYLTKSSFGGTIPEYVAGSGGTLISLCCYSSGSKNWIQSGKPWLYNTLVSELEKKPVTVLIKMGANCTQMSKSANQELVSIIQKYCTDIRWIVPKWEGGGSTYGKEKMNKSIQTVINDINSTTGISKIQSDWKYGTKDDKSENDECGHPVKSVAEKWSTEICSSCGWTTKGSSKNMRSYVGNLTDSSWKSKPTK
ncbi:MAG: hypothetical protein NC548_21290 [Lachnospiraceae bacterium]|nr:hypothetical protein [Lachnospiraceae bacterium]